jgi:hypothetical protein
MAASGRETRSHLRRFSNERIRRLDCPAAVIEFISTCGAHYSTFPESHTGPNQTPRHGWIDAIAESSKQEVFGTSALSAGVGQLRVAATTQANPQFTPANYSKKEMKTPR